MTITYKEIKRSIRFKEKDNNKTRFSDYDIREAVNEALRYFSTSYALQNSDFLEKQVTYDEAEMNAEIIANNEELPESEQASLYDFRNEGIELPEDYLSLQDVVGVYGEPLHPVEGIRVPHHNEYKVMGDRIYFGVPSVKILYKASLGQVKEDADTVEVPVMFKDSIVKISCMVLENNASTDVMMEAVNDAVEKLVPRRRYANARRQMPFMV